jgi:pilus assembly protein Flp/PilA
VFNLFREYRDCESGATAIEYVLLAALVGVGIVAGAASLGGNLGNSYNNVGNGVETHVKL